jgi:hypothetical protein
MRRLDRKFFRDGRLAEVYPASSLEMESDGAVEMERIRIMDSPHRNMEGWVLSQCLQRTVDLP